jgi:hypothetical protein
MIEFDEPKDHIKSVSDFLKIKESWLYTSQSLPGKWMYRGLEEYEYQLIPGIGRLINQRPFLNNKKKLFKFEIDAFNEFRISSYNELHEANEFILLAVAQHHSLQTRLLDWSFSPLVALFFAVEDENKYDKDGALVVLQSRFPFNDFCEAQSPFDDKLDDYHFLFAPALSPRIRAQQGVFQLFKDPTTEFKEASFLGKFKIPANSKKGIKSELNDLGITYKTLFPVLDGLCKSINYDKLKSID